jgi:hypothetical protein
MGRTWIGEGAPYSEHPPEGLWWYSAIPDSSIQLVIDTYLKGVKRGRALPPDYASELSWWLHELSREHELTTRTKRYWVLPAYALKHGFKRSGFLKIFRRLEDTAKELIAKKLIPGIVPAHRVRVELPEDRKLAIRARFLEVQDFKKVADEFGIEPFRVGQLCREEKKKLIAEREQSKSTATPTTTEPEQGNPDFENVLF